MSRISTATRDRHDTIVGAAIDLLEAS